MGWTNLPPSTYQKTANSWVWLDQVRQAILEKYQAVGTSLFPHTSIPWASSNITAQGSDARGWYVDFSPAINCDSVGTWGVGIGGVTKFAAVVDDPDPKKCVRLGPVSDGSFPIGHGTTATRLYLTAPKANHPTYLDYNNLVGKKLYLITGYSDAENPWWNERWLQPPNDVIGYRTVTEGKGYTCSAGVLLDTLIGGNSTVYAGQHIWLGGNRFTITAVDDHSINFANPNISPLPTPSNGDSYAVIHATGFYKPNNEFFCWRWHDVPSKGWLGHDHILNNVGATALRSTTVIVREDNGLGGCMNVNHDCTETDVWVSDYSYCDSPNTCKTPYFYRSLRAAQIEANGLCVRFVENKDYTSAVAIPNFVPATWLKLAAINSGTLTTSTPAWNGGTNHWETTADSTAFAALDASAKHDDGIWWALVDTTWGNAVLQSGRAKVYSDIPSAMTVPAEIPRTNPAGGVPFVDSQENAMSDPYQLGTPHSVSLVYSYGFTRKAPKEFKYAYERTGFVPEKYLSGGVYVVVDPPTASYPGIYETRPASDHYTYVDLQGSVQDSTYAEDVINVDFKARYLGDNFNDPGLLESQYTGGVISHRLLLSTYTDIDDSYKFYADEFRVFEDFQGSFGTGGSATKGGTTYLTDTSKSWWKQGTLITHTGTASAGNTTSLTIGVTDGFWTQTFDGHGRFKGMAVEIHTQDDVNGNPVWEKRFITDHTGSIITWSEAISVSANSKDFLIREPKGRLNYWKDKTVTLTSPDGKTVYTDVPIIGSDDDTLFFAAQTTATAIGWKYTVDEMLPGAVYIRNGSNKWIRPTVLGTQLSHAEAKNIHPDTKTRYGYIRKRDYLKKENFKELRDGLDVLNATKNGSVAWNANGEYNIKRLGSNYIAGYHDADTVSGYYNSMWIHSQDGSNADGQTFLHMTYDANYDWDPATYDVTRNPDALPASFDLSRANYPFDAAPRCIASGSFSASDINYDGILDETTGVYDPFSDSLIYDEFIQAEWAERSYAYAHKTGLPTILAGNVDVYAYATMDDPTVVTDWDITNGYKPTAGTHFWGHSINKFNNYGDPVLFRKWSKIDTQTISADVWSAKLGSTTKPANLLPAAFIAPPIGFAAGDGTMNDNEESYRVTNSETVCRWDMTFKAGGSFGSAWGGIWS